jgi:mRNA export factor
MSGLFGSAAASAAASTTVGDLKQDVALSDPPSDSISELSFSPAPNGPDFLAISSWDNKVRIYEIAQNGQSQGRHAFEHSQPVLGCDFSKVSERQRTAGESSRLDYERLTRCL